MSISLTYKRPFLYGKQLDGIFHAKRYGCIEASTKSGKTHGCIVWLTEKALQGRRGYNFWWVAPVYSQAKIAYSRLKNALPAALYESNESDMTIALANGAIIWFKSGDKPDSLYGEDVYAAVVDEASRCKEDVWHAIRSTLTATKGPIRIIGNVKGRKNWAYHLARKAEAGAKNMKYCKITAYDAVAARILSSDEIEDARSVLPEAVFKELYLAEPNDDGGNPFGLEAIQECIKPHSTEPIVAWGWDLAKHVDWTVGVGLDQLGYVVNYHRFQLTWQQTVERILAVTRDKPALVDSTGVGDPILEQLQRPSEHSYNPNFEGYKFTSGSKQKLMEGLAVAIQHGETSYPDGVISNELESFEYEYHRTGVRYSAPQGQNDDCVMALALAVHKLKHRSAMPSVRSL